MTGGQCFTKAGQAKVRYDTRAAAKRARQRAFEKFGDDPGAPYRCQQCGWFHLGHYPTSPAIRQRLQRRHRREAG